MTAKNTLIISLVVIALAMGGCFGSAGGGKGNQSMQPTINAKACYADAQQQLSPQWASASALDRAVAAFNVITTCEGSN